MMAKTTCNLRELKTAVSFNRKGTGRRLVGGSCQSVLFLFVINLLAVSGNAEDRRQSAIEEHSQASGKIVVSSVKSSTNDSSFIVKYGLTRADYARILSQIPTVNTAIPVRECREVGNAGGRMARLRLIGTTPAFGDANGIQMSQGRFLIDKDQKRLNNVAVLHHRVAQLLFPGENAIGKSIRIGRNYFLVVGLVAKSDARIKIIKPGMGRVENLNVYIPISTMRSRLGDIEITTQSGTREAEQFELSRIEITVKNRDDVETTATVIRRLLKRFHEKSDYTVTVPQ